MFTSIYTLMEHFSTTLAIFIAVTGLHIAIFVARIFNLSTGSQAISDRMKSFKITLQNFKLANIEMLSQGSLTALDNLLDQLSEGSPISPLSAFSLDNSTIASGFGLMLTYTIVLLQFKTGEDFDHKEKE